MPAPLSPKAFMPVAFAPEAGDDAGLIVDGRRQLGWRKRLPARLGTTALWGVLVVLLHGMALAAVGAGVATPLLLRLLLPRPRAAKPEAPVLLSPAQPLAPSEDPQRQRLAEAFGISEAALFRARHAQICTVHHDDQGEIVAFSLPVLDDCPATESSPASATSPVLERHAHSVG